MGKKPSLLSKWITIEQIEIWPMRKQARLCPSRFKGGWILCWSKTVIWLSCHRVQLEPWDLAAAAQKTGKEQQPRQDAPPPAPTTNLMVFTPPTRQQPKTQVEKAQNYYCTFVSWQYVKPSLSSRWHILYPWSLPTALSAVDAYMSRKTLFLLRSSWF